MGTLANSVDADEMQQGATFHWGLHCLLRKKIFKKPKYILFRKYFKLCPINMTWAMS